MGDSSIKKVSADTAPSGEMGQRYLASGKRVAMRLWETGPGTPKEARSRDYETVGYVIDGRATLNIEGQTVTLAPGDSWLVPAGASHSYEVHEALLAIEATSPPARAHGRDE